MTPQAEKRLKVLQSLDTLGAGFQLASHDLDMRGGGNLLGEEQSGPHQRSRLRALPADAGRSGAALQAGARTPAEETWSPSITIGAPVTIPEDYVPDLQLRLRSTAAWRRSRRTRRSRAFAAELIDRFGPLPEEVGDLLKLVAIKALCRRAHVEKVEAGPKGVIVGFRDDSFANPAGLVRFVAEQGNDAKVRPDMRVVFMRDFETIEARLEGTRQILTHPGRPRREGEAKGCVSARP